MIGLLKAEGERRRFACFGRGRGAGEPKRLMGEAQNLGGTQVKELRPPLDLLKKTEPPILIMRKKRRGKRESPEKGRRNRTPYPFDKKRRRW